MRGALVVVAATVAGACGSSGGNDQVVVDARLVDTPDEEIVDAPTVDTPLIDTPDHLVDAPAVDAPPAVCQVPPPAPGASMMIGAAGGTITLGNAVSVTIPAGALAADTEVTLRPTNLELAQAERALSAAYQLGPPTLTLAVPATLTVDLGDVPTQPDAIGLRVGPATGPFTLVTTTRTGSAYSATVSGATHGFASRTSAAPAPTSTCAATATPDDTTYLFQNANGGGNYFTSYARATSQGFAAITTHQQDALWNVFSYGYSAAGASTGTVNLTGNVIHSIFGGHVATSGAEVLVAYDSNQTQGSEIWVARKTATGSTIGTPVRISEDPTLLSLRPQIVAIPGGAFVVWMARHPTNPVVYLRAAVLDSALALQRRFDITPASGSMEVPTSFALVASSAGVGVAWSWSLSTGLLHGVNYQAFGHTGCPTSAVIPLADAYLVAEDVAATVSGDHVLVASAGTRVASNARVARLRAVHLTTGLLGATRVLDDAAMTHLGVAAHTGGFQLAGWAGGLAHRWLGPELDPRTSITAIATTGSISRAMSIASSTAGDAALVTWTEVASGMSRGRVKVVACTP